MHVGTTCTGRTTEISSEIPVALTSLRKESFDSPPRTPGELLYTRKSIAITRHEERLSTRIAACRACKVQRRFTIRNCCACYRIHVTSPRYNRLLFRKLVVKYWSRKKVPVAPKRSKSFSQKRNVGKGIEYRAASRLQRAFRIIMTNARVVGKKSTDSVFEMYTSSTSIFIPFSMRLMVWQRC